MESTSRLREVSILRRIFGALSGGGGIIWWFCRETTKAFFFDHIIHADSAMLASTIEYGPPVILAVLCVYLLWKPEWSSEWWILGNRLIPLRLAARRAYEATRHTAFARVAEREGRTSEGILDYYAGHIILHKNGVHAQRTPSTIYEPIPERETTSLRIIPGTDSLSPIFGVSRTPVYVNIKVEVRALAENIEFIRRISEPWPN